MPYLERDYVLSVESSYLQMVKKEILISSVKKINFQIIAKKEVSIFFINHFGKVPKVKSCFQYGKYLVCNQVVT
jgi:hypothetical protein